MTTRRQLALGVVAAIGLPKSAGAAARPRGAVLHADSFRNGLDRWFGEFERGGSAKAANGVLDIETPAGATLWFRPELSGPIRIEYEARAVSAGGKYDRVSDLNCFWMATDARSPGDLFARPRSGAFADYNELRTYYVGMGGNSNTTTRFRRYVGDAVERPIRPQDDLRGKADLIAPNRWYRLALVADGGRIEFWRDGRKVFDYADPEPYTHGWFGLRTTWNHMQVRNFRVLSLR